MTKITVIDSIMGAGKSSWAIQHANKNKEVNLLYVTPYLNETERFKTCVDKPISTPENKGKGKLESIKPLLQRQDDIASTHALFRNFDKATMQLIRDSHYTLVLDEVLDVIEPLRMKRDDIKLLKDGCISVDDDGFVIWNEDRKELDTSFNNVKNLALSHQLMLINDQFFLWHYPKEMFMDVFDEIYIMTYLFKGSILYNYFKLYGIQYRMASIASEEHGEYSLVDYYAADTVQYADLLEIYEGKMDDKLPQKPTGLSKQWFRGNSRSKDKSGLKQLKNNVSNYQKNIIGCKAEQFMWTTYKDFAMKLKGGSITYYDPAKEKTRKKVHNFVPFNSRATNAFADKTVMAYCVNVYMNPSIVVFFRERGVEVNQDLYALSNLLQWIWRSAIRKGEPVSIYIPSVRMRNLLYSWLKLKPTTTLENAT